MYRCCQLVGINNVSINNFTFNTIQICVYEVEGLGKSVLEYFIPPTLIMYVYFNFQQKSITLGNTSENIKGVET